MWMLNIHQGILDVFPTSLFIFLIWNNELLTHPRAIGNYSLQQTYHVLQKL